MKNKDYPSYQSQLNSPYWKEKRNYIIEQRGSKCERCGNISNLQVHHKKYLKDKLAWDYPDDLLECLCGSCHMKEHNITKNKDTFGLTKFSLSEVNDILRYRALLCVNIKDEVVNYIVSSCEVTRVTKTTISFKIPCQYHKYLNKNFRHFIKIKTFDVDFILKKAIQDFDLMNFSGKK